ncbi:MAG TPA: hypothetical protein VMF90_12520 [Rhizobiaceae bacterium]|nr:hypothetical protein [Rhizobiaceae bacterium]
MHVLEAALISNALNSKKAKRIESDEPQPTAASRPFYKRLSIQAVSAVVALVAVVTFLEIASADAPAQAEFTLIASHAG